MALDILLTVSLDITFHIKNNVLHIHTGGFPPYKGAKPPSPMLDEGLPQYQSEVRPGTL
jgi:hypothetical protein